MTANRSPTGLTDIIQDFLNEYLPGRKVEELIGTQSGEELIDTILVELNRSGFLDRVKLVTDGLYS